MNAEVGVVIGIKLLGAFASFLVIFTVAKYSGAAVTGDYAMALATVNIFAIFALFGLDQTLTKAIGGDIRVDRKDLARASLFRAIKAIAPLSLLLAVALFVLAPYAQTFGVTTAALRAVSFSVVAFAFLRIGVVSLRASGYVLWSQFLDSAHNFLMLGGVVACILLDYELTGAIIAGFYTIALIITSAVCWALVWREVRHWPRGGFVSESLATASVPILLASLIHSITQWVIMASIGAGLGQAEVGSYRVAVQIVMTIALMMTTIESLVGPQLAGDFRLNDLAGAWKRHRQATLMMLGCAIVPLAICLVLPEQILGIFGGEFVIAALPLVILSGAQLVNVITGPIGAMMVMSGHQVFSLRLALLGLVIAGAMSWLLVPVIGMAGAALAYGGALISRNLVAFVLMKAKLRPRD